MPRTLAARVLAVRSALARRMSNAWTRSGLPPVPAARVVGLRYGDGSIS